jgi:hypothetical protein
MMPKQQGRGNPFTSVEFVLVFTLVVALLIVILMIFLFIKGGDATAVQTERKDFLAILLGAFGAWIGAGAAYFFGRENLNAATESMLRMRGLSPEERLAQTTLKDMKPKAIPKTFVAKDKVGDVLTWFDEDEARYFAVMLDDQKRVDKVVGEDALHRFLRDKIDPKSPKVMKYDDVVKSNLGDVIKHIEEKAKEPNRDAILTLINTGVVADEGQTASFANQTMAKEKKYVTIVVDAKRAPLGYVSATDIRRFLLSLPS